MGRNFLWTNPRTGELAKILGATPEALSRALRRMSDAGLLKVDGRSVQILDRESLGELAEGD
jgi:CRP/FNR family transcriptional regulator, dissimilatory nitrate respiration regulator